MADQEAKQNVEKFARRDFLKGAVGARSRNRADTEDSAGTNAEDDVSLESESNTAGRPKKRQGERDAIQLISYGLYVLTTAHGPDVNAITCNWLTQISFEPLLVLVAIEKESYSHQLLQESGVFAINFLSKDQNHLARSMAAPHRIKPYKLAGVAHHNGITGVPLLDEAIAFLECEVRQVLEVDGDHTLFVGEVVGGEAVTRYAEPLTLLASGLRYK